jgi:dihydrofolate synthase/folylpolyglutamate synthase
VQVIGTNGKGGVVAYLEAALKASGKSFGITTSPHLVEFRERIRTHRGQIGEAEVVAFVEWAKSQGFTEAPAFFDLTTALAFKHFAEQGVGLAVVEAGVGGLSDTTHVLPKVVLSIISSIGEDHLEALGGSLETVARDKAGAIRPGVPVVTGAGGMGLKIVGEIARQCQAPLYVLGQHDPLYGLGEYHPLFELKVEPILKGAMQRRNAHLAVAALRLLGFSETHISTGLSTAQHPGRMQEVWLEGARVILDGAHNPPAAQALAAEFAYYHLVYGGFPRKDYSSVLKALLPKALSVTYTSAGKGGLKGEVLSQVYPAPYYPDPMSALDQALSNASQHHQPVLVTGSLYLIGALLPYLSPEP